MMTQWSGQQWYSEPPSPSVGASVTLLEMTEDEMNAAAARERPPFGFVPPVAEKATVKPRIRLKVRP